MTNFNRRYITARHLLARWDKSRSWLEEQLRNDPAFPRPVRFGRSQYRSFKLDDVEQYEAAAETAVQS